MEVLELRDEETMYKVKEFQVENGQFYRTKNGNIYLAVNPSESVYISNERNAGKQFRYIKCSVVVPRDTNNRVEIISYDEVKSILMLML
jgi:hypothetical protein